MNELGLEVEISVLERSALVIEQGLGGLADQAHHLDVRIPEGPGMVGDLQGLPLGLEGLLAVGRHTTRL